MIVAFRIFSMGSERVNGRVNRAAWAVHWTHLADKVTMVAIYMAFYNRGDIPPWLFWAFIARDISLVRLTVPRLTYKVAP